MQPKPQPTTGSQSVWKLDRSTSIVKFSVKKLFAINVPGQFKGLDGSIVFDGSDIAASSVHATFAAANIDTSNSRRDEHLRSRSFLDVKSYPWIEFESSEVSRGTDRDMLIVKGALTIKGKTKSVTLTVTQIDRSTAPDGTEVIYYIAQTEINRYDFGINAWRGVIGKSVKVAIDVQANREQ